MSGNAVLRHGPLVQPGKVTFNLWAPAAQTVALILGGRAFPMQPAPDGWFSRAVPEAGSGSRYQFEVDGRLRVPDPASHYQPEDVSGPSEVIDHEFGWRAAAWRGRPWSEAVIYELHLGSFSAEGTFRGAIAHLDHLVETGITAIELMPVADFAGARNWGYDGVLLFAPDSAYGRPEDLKALIDAAHERGLMVFLDVVYNHFGPEGNYLEQYAPHFFTEDGHTPWGKAIDYRRAPVRAFAIQNALHWLSAYRFDGLRLDAVHAIRMRGEPDILRALAEAVGTLAEAEGRHIHLILENDDNAADLLAPQRSGGAFRAQWNDDYHHAWHVLLTGETAGYYEDYPRPHAQLFRALAQGFVYQGEASLHRRGARRGQPSRGLPPAAFVNFLQNHDQIGNRPYGERLSAIASPRAVEAALAVTLLAPFVPLLFMGEEWGAPQPFPFFCDFTGVLADAVRNGRRREFAAMFRAARPGEEPPDALALDTFLMTKLDWAGGRAGEAGRRLTLVRTLLEIRRRHVVPLLQGCEPLQTAGEIDGHCLRCAWLLGVARLTLQANLSDMAGEDRHGRPQGAVIWGNASGDGLPPWHVAWWLEGA
ncbi:MAG TPA: malto-oligosyltrehalose trehalohydrolase [Ferrovibrio sp.]|uniref:malto-oligosyltrehalose trehalohydrolase n=1 Tax=Ferrovibrio sp. TaxID=1917215 RepID=UPI002ED0187A